MSLRYDKRLKFGLSTLRIFNSPFDTVNISYVSMIALCSQETSKPDNIIDLTGNTYSKYGISMMDLPIQTSSAKLL